MPAERTTKNASPSKTAEVSITSRSAHMTSGSAWSRERRRAQALAAQAAAAAELAALDAENDPDEYKPDDVLEISSDDDPLGSGPPWDIRPDDTLYRGRSTRSVVGSVQAVRDASPVHTRSRVKEATDDDDRADAVATAKTTDVAGLGDTRPKPRPKPRPKRKSAAVVVSSGDEVDTPSPSPVKGAARAVKSGDDPLQVQPPPKKARLASPAPEYDTESDDGLPSLIDIVRGRGTHATPAVRHVDEPENAVPTAESYISDLKKRRTSPVRYVDDEAMEEDDDGLSIHSDAVDDASGNEYDLDDPFIDDSAHSARDFDDAHEVSASKPLKKEPRSVKLDRRAPSAVTPPRRRSHASVIKTEVQDGEPVPQKSKGKGKGRAPVSSRTPTPEPMLHDREDGVPTDEEGLSAHELAEIREAARRSLLPASTRVGETSSQGSLHTTPPKIPSTKDPKVTVSPSKTAATGSSGVPQAKTLTRKRINIADLVHRHASAARRSGKTPPATSSREVTLEELRLDRRCATLTDRDEVLDRALMDDVLEGTYDENPPLRRGRFIPWTTAAGVGRVRFSAWADQCPDMDGEIALNAVLFVRSRHIINPSRASPCDVALYLAGSSTTRYSVYMYDAPLTPCVAFTTGLVERSQLVAPSNTGLRQRSIQVVPHSQEFESMEGFIREITGFPEIHAQFARDALQFSTRAQGSSPANDGGWNQGEYFPRSSPKNRKLKTSPQKMFHSRPTTSSSSRVLADNFSLPNDVVVPVYDARNVDSFDFDVDLHRLSEKLPLYTDGEIPYGSFVGVGYTMTVYQASNGNWTLSCNIQWVVLFGTPSDD